MRSVSVPRAVRMMIGTPRAGADRAADVAAVAVGQVEVEQDQVGLERSGQLERAGGGGGDVRLEALAGERLGERLRRSTLVLDEQDAGAIGIAMRAQCRRVFARLCPGLTRRWRALGGSWPMVSAMKPSRHQIAAGVTVVALGLLATVALASGGSGPPEPQPSPQPAAATPEVRTEVVRETVAPREARASSSPSASASSAQLVAERRLLLRPQRRARAGRHAGRPRRGATRAATAAAGATTPRTTGPSSASTTTAVTTTPATTAATTTTAATGGPRAGPWRRRRLSRGASRPRSASSPGRWPPSSPCSPSWRCRCGRAATRRSGPRSRRRPPRRAG